MSALKKVTVNGTLYLGELKEKDGKYTLSSALMVHDMGTGTISTYLKAKNSGNLETMKFGGGLLEPMVADLNPNEQMELDMAELAMGQAKKTALPALENDAFDGILGKP